MSLLLRRSTRRRPVSAAVHALPLHYELIPTKSFDQAMADLPALADVSVTCSPVRGIAATQECSLRLLGLGHRVVPHFAARMVEDREHAARLARWLREHSIDEVFVVAGDAPEPLGPYEGAFAFIRDLLDGDPGVERVGVTGYPEGHAVFDEQVLAGQLAAKNDLLQSAGIDGWVSTQMCFDAIAIRAWIHRQRARGIALPIRLGVPGVVDRTRLMTMGARLGIGASLRYLGSNRSTIKRLMAPGGYDPTALIAAFDDDVETLGIEALHSFTFNSVAETRAWHSAIVTSEHI